MAIIENQNVAKRRIKQNRAHTSNYAADSASSGNNYNSARYNSEFMSHFDQKPARSRKKRSSSAGISVFASFSDNIKQFVKPNARRRKTQRKFPNSPKRNEKKSSGFSFPVPSPAKILVITGTIFVAVIALKWESPIELKTPEVYAIQPSAEKSGTPTTEYASTGALGNIGNLSLGTENKEQQTESSRQPAENLEQTAEAEKPTVSEETPPSTSVLPPQIIEEDTARILLSFDWQQHTVKRGESVSSIAKKFGVSVGAVIASNEIGGLCFEYRLSTGFPTV